MRQFFMVVQFLQNVIHLLSDKIEFKYCYPPHDQIDE